MNNWMVIVLTLCLLSSIVACTGSEQQESSQTENRTQPTIQNSAPPTSRPSSPSDTLPSFTTAIGDGPFKIRVNNPNPFSVAVGVRSGSEGKNFTVRADGSSSISVPFGTYDIYFVYSNNPSTLYQGDSIRLWTNDIEIQLVESFGGNYGIRPVNP